jgi:hypothetical protein
VAVVVSALGESVVLALEVRHGVELGSFDPATATPAETMRFEELLEDLRLASVEAELVGIGAVLERVERDLVAGVVEEPSP